MLVHARHRNREKLHHALIAHCSGRHCGVKRAQQFHDAISISRPRKRTGSWRSRFPQTAICDRKLLRKLCNPRINSSSPFLSYFSSPTESPPSTVSNTERMRNREGGGKNQREFAFDARGSERATERSLSGEVHTGGRELRWCAGAIKIAKMKTLESLR